MTCDNFFWIISIALSAATLATMIFGFRLGKNALSRNLVLYGEKATEMFNYLKAKVPNQNIEKYPYGGGNLTTPQIKIEKIILDPKIKLPKWGKHKHSVRYFEKKDNEIIVNEWLI